MKHSLIITFGILLTALSMHSANASEQEHAHNHQKNERATAPQNQTSAESGNPLVVNAYDYAFDIPTEVKSGWAQVIVNNQRAEEIHEVTIVRLPDEIDYQTYLSEFIEPWMEIWQGMKDGDITRANLFSTASTMLPEWQSELDYRHARGIVSPGKNAEAYAYLPPGTYAVECWLKNEDGGVHIAHGMIRELTVTASESPLQPPQQGTRLQVSSNGIHMPDAITTGEQTFIVEVEPTEAGTPVHADLHLIRYDENVNPSNIVRWLDWYNVDGLTHPAPATFLGGYSTYGSALIDNKAYFTVTINEPGDYAWVIQSDPESPVWMPFTVDE